MTITDTFTFEPRFWDSMRLLDLTQKERAISQIQWFEDQTRQDRKRKSQAIESSVATRRKLRFIKVSNGIKLLYVESSNHGCNWVWAGPDARLVAEAAKINSTPAQNLEILSLKDLDTYILNEQRLPSVRAELPAALAEDLLGWVSTTEEWITTTEETALLADEAASLVDRIRAKALDITVGSLPSEADDEKFKKLLEHYNATTVERDTAAKELAAAKKRIATLETNLRVADATTRELNDAKRRLQALKHDLDTANATAQRRMANSLAEVAKDTIREACAKIVDDHATILSKTGRPRDEEQADDLRRLSMKIRALKV